MAIITEIEAAKRLGVTRQTMRNWRCGYNRPDGTAYAPKIGTAVWRKIGQTVVYNTEFIEKLETAKHDLDTILAGTGATDAPGNAAL